METAAPAHQKLLWLALQRRLTKANEDPILELHRTWEIPCSESS
jgi:hypothetical protein